MGGPDSCTMSSTVKLICDGAWEWGRSYAESMVASRTPLLLLVVVVLEVPSDRAGIMRRFVEARAILFSSTTGMIQAIGDMKKCYRFFFRLLTTIGCLSRDDVQPWRDAWSLTVRARPANGAENTRLFWVIVVLKLVLQLERQTTFYNARDVRN